MQDLDYIKIRKQFIPIKFEEKIHVDRIKCNLNLNISYKIKLVNKILN